MNTFVQIYNNRAHWIFQSDETLEQLKSRFSPECIFVDITNLDPMPEEGWDYDGVTFTPHQDPPPSIQEQIDQLNKDYTATDNQLLMYWLAAAASGDTATQTDIQTEREALLVDYQAQLQVIQGV